MTNKEYIILLPNEKARTYSYVTLFILLINCVVLGFIFFNSPGGKIKNVALAGLSVSFLSLVFFLIIFFRKKASPWRFEISFIILAVVWIILSKYLLALCILCFAVIGFYTSKKFKVVFSAGKILYPSFPVKTFLWNEVSNVMLKDNVLTIDLKNNKLIQAVVEKESADGIEESSFNEFCRDQMNLTEKTQSR